MNALKAWKAVDGYYRKIAAASRGNGGNKIAHKWSANLGKQFKPKYNYNTNFLYRGLSSVGPNNIHNISGYSSWTSNINTAKKFAYHFNDPIIAREYAKQRGIILRIHTKILKGVPVINMKNRNEPEYILPPMKIVFNKNNGNILTVKNVIINQRWAPPNRPSIIPRTAARRLPVNKKPWWRRVLNTSKSQS